MALLGATCAESAPTSGFPEWAYPPCDRTAPATEPDSSKPLSLAGSKLHFTEAVLARASNTPDWFPLEHTKMPAIVAASHSVKKIACGYCHLADGNGRPENAKVAGLSVAYIRAQVWSVHTQDRRPAQPGWAPSALMKEAIADLSDQEIAQAAEYFSRQRAKKYLKVIESDLVPRHGTSCGIFIPADGRPAHLHEAILEMPIDAERFERRDPHTAYIAYVPKGSVERGRQLAGTGENGRTQPCAGCHGADLRSGPSSRDRPWQGGSPAICFANSTAFNPVREPALPQSRCCPWLRN